MWSTGNHMHFRGIQEYNCTCNSQIAVTLASCNYLTVTGTIIILEISLKCE